VDLQKTEKNDAAMLETVVVGGNLSQLSPADRLLYYRQVCESIGLNPLTKPFAYIMLNGKLTLYARRDATDQLRKLHAVSLEIVSRETIGDVYQVTARAKDRDGRTDESTGAVAIKGLSGEALANAYMKAETKAKRRVTLSLVGLGWLDESEAASVPGAQLVTVDDATGEVVESGASHTTKPTTQAHWITREDARTAWWAYTGETLGLTRDEVHRALGVQHMSEYTGTMLQAKTAVAAYAAQCQARPVQTRDVVRDENGLPF